MAEVTLTVTSTLNGGSVTAHVYEDVGNDGTGANSITDPDGNVIDYDNHDSSPLSGGTETIQLVGYDAGANNGYYVRFVWAVPSNPTNTSPTISSWELETTGAVEAIVASGAATGAAATVVGIGAPTETEPAVAAAAAAPAGVVTDEQPSYAKLGEAKFGTFKFGEAALLATAGASQPSAAATAESALVGATVDSQGPDGVATPVEAAKAGAATADTSAATGAATAPTADVSFEEAPATRTVSAEAAVGAAVPEDITPSSIVGVFEAERPVAASVGKNTTGQDAIQFHPTHEDYMEADYEVFNPTDLNFGFGCRVKVIEGSTGLLVGHTENGDTSTEGYILIVQSNGNLRAAVDPGAEPRSSIGGNVGILDGQWHDIIIGIEDETATGGEINIVFYVDGVETHRSVDLSPFSAPTNANGSFKVGSSDPTNPNYEENFLSALIDDVVFFDDAPTVADVTAFSNGDIPASVAAHFPFTETAGSTVAETVSGNDGTLNGNPNLDVGRLEHGAFGKTTEGVSIPTAAAAAEPATIAPGKNTVDTQGPISASVAANAFNQKIARLINDAELVADYETEEALVADYKTSEDLEADVDEP